jgi:dTDP-4-amino-4,6-dideoxygalactose transaminase
MSRISLFDLPAQHLEVAEEVKQVWAEIAGSGQYALGPYVEKFEKETAEYCGISQAVATNSGTDALMLALMVNDFPAGSEIITTPYTFFATSEVIVRTGLKPVFVDIEPATFNIDPEIIEAAVTEKTAAIMPVDTYGQCADYTGINAIAGKHKLAVIADAAEVFGAAQSGKKAGALAPFNAFSFYPTKSLGGYGDGGMLTLDDPELAKKARELRIHGLQPDGNYREIGILTRMDALQAAGLSCKLRHIDRWNKIRRELAGLFNELLLEIDEIVSPAEMQGNSHIYYLYVVRAKDRDGLRRHLNEQGIDTGI